MKKWRLFGVFIAGLLSSSPALAGDYLIGAGYFLEEATYSLHQENGETLEKGTATSAGQAGVALGYASTPKLGSSPVGLGLQFELGGNGFQTKQQVVKSTSQGKINLDLGTITNNNLYFLMPSLFVYARAGGGFFSLGAGMGYANYKSEGDLYMTDGLEATDICKQAETIELVQGNCQKVAYSISGKVFPTQYFAWYRSRSWGIRLAQVQFNSSKNINQRLAENSTSAMLIWFF